MPEISFPPEFEEQLRRSMAAPEANIKSMQALRERFITQGVEVLGQARRGGSMAKAANPAQPFFARRPAWQWAVLALVIIIVLALAAPGAVKALRLMFGYIPGVGVIEQSPTALVLAEPAQVERDGIRLTVEQAVSTAEKTVVLYRFTPPEIKEGSKQGNASAGDPRLRLPDGGELPVRTGQRLSSDSSDILYALEFDPLPAGVHTVTLELPRLAGMPPGAGPENWQILLSFKPMDPAQVSLPVVEVEPTPTTPANATAAPETPASVETTVESALTPDTHGFQLTLEKTVELADGYLLMGSLAWSDAGVTQPTVTLGEPIARDAAGREIPSDFAPPETRPQAGELRLYWARKIAAKDFASPLSLQFFPQVQETVDETFPFDPGANPQDGQTWALDRSVNAGDHELRVVEARYSHPAEDLHVFEFTMTAGPGITGAMLYEQDHTPAGGGGGGGIPQDNVPFTGTLLFEGELPAGPMTVVVHSLDVLVPGEWVVTWTR